MSSTGEGLRPSSLLTAGSPKCRPVRRWRRLSSHSAHILRHLSPPSFCMQARYISISTSGGSAGEGRSERRVRLSLDVEIDEIDR